MTEATGQLRNMAGDYQNVCVIDQCHAEIWQCRTCASETLGIEQNRSATIREELWRYSEQYRLSW